MKDPLRLVDAGGTEFERSLLLAASEEEPSSDVQARMLAGVVSAGAAVGLLSGVQRAGEAAALGSTPVGASGAALAGAGGSIAPQAAAGLSGAWLAKWGVIGALASSVVAAGVAVSGVALQAGDESVPARLGAAPVTMQAPAAPAAPRRAEVPLAAKELAPPHAAPSPLDRVEGAPSRAPASERAAPSSAHALGPEIELLDSARRALGEGDAERALNLIAGYHRRFPTGALSQEATVLEVDALEAKGRAEQATDLKEQFLAEHPDSAHTQRVQRSGQAR